MLLDPSDQLVAARMTPTKIHEMPARQDRVAGGGQMDADLMRTAGEEVALDEGAALMRGEQDERDRLKEAVGELRTAWHAQTRGQGSLALLTSSLAYLAPVVPLVVALPRYLGGELQLGVLIGIDRRCHFARIGAQAVDDLEFEDADQPGAQAGATAEALRLFERRQHGLGHHIFGPGVIS